MSYESYVEAWRITAWRDGCVYATESDGCGWVADSVIEANRPGESQLIYAAANDAFAKSHLTIRVAR